MQIQEPNFRGGASGQTAVEQLGSIAREREKTKRLLVGAACLLFVVAAVLVLFAPPGKETLSYAIGVALVVMALGAIGSATFKFRLPGVSVETNADHASNGPYREIASLKEVRKK